MARPQQEAIETFISITGASEAVALQKLEEHGGDLNAAVNAHFSEGDNTNTRPTSVPVAQNDFMAIDDPVQVDSQGLPLPLLSATRSLNPFAVLDNISRSLFDGRGTAEFPSREPWVSHPREVREIPIEFKDGDGQSGNSSTGPTIEDVTESTHVHGPEVHGPVIIDDDNDEDLPAAPVQASGQTERKDDVFERRPGPSVPRSDAVIDYSNDIEEEMLQAAIEASKRDVNPEYQFGVPNDSSSTGLNQRLSRPEDVELERAVTLSLQTAEQEKALREQKVSAGTVEQGSLNSSGFEEHGSLPEANGRQGSGSSKKEIPSKFKLEAGNSSVQEEAEEMEEQPLVRHRSRRLASGPAEPTTEVGRVVDSPPTSPGPGIVATHPQRNGEAFHSDEWGGISSEEHDEAVMLEAALFGGIPEGASYRFAYPPHPVLQTGSDRTADLYPRRVPRPPSPSLAAQRLLREQQDDEYFAALQADREKELKAMEEAEMRRLEEVAAREAALLEEKKHEEESHRKLLEKEEFERLLAATEASLPQEPGPDDESAVTLLVRMPDGSRRGRRFLKSDKLQYLFDFIDVGRSVKPGTYRLVRPYPRIAFSDGESELSLSELGLSSKQEALFLELI